MAKPLSNSAHSKPTSNLSSEFGVRSSELENFQPTVKMRQITFAQAINEALVQAMSADPAVYIIGEGVPDPKGIFGTTLGLRDKFGGDRVLDMPVAENGMTGVAIGSALMGMRPVLVHQRVDFVLLAMDQMVNQAAKWHYMFGGKMSVPLVVRHWNVDYRKLGAVESAAVGGPAVTTGILRTTHPT